MRRHKYRAKPVVLDGVWYASQREAAHAQKLAILQRTGKVSVVLRQVPFEIAPAVRDPTTGKVTARAERYVADFLVYWTDGALEIHEVKGFRTREYLRKKRRVEALYPIRILEV